MRSQRSILERPRTGRARGTAQKETPAGTWFGKQLVLDVLGIRAAELARAHGLSVRNIECANG
ncbi:hypothetical protein J7E62_20675 [Variovorax paradoxus]|nr:hypothetical protein [Variovorax paradoxus]